MLDRDCDVDGIGGSSFFATEKGVEVEALVVGMGEGGGGGVGMEPFVGEDSSEFAGRAVDRRSEAAGAEGRTVDKEV